MDLLLKIYHSDVLPWLCAAGAFVAWLLARRESKADKAELELIRQRASGPYISPSNARFHMLYFENGNPGEVGFRQMGRGDMLDALRAEVDKEHLEAGHPIFVVLDVSGEACPEVEFILNGTQIQLRREADINDAAGRYFLSYPYRPPDHGKSEALEIRYLSISGVRGVRRYTAEHGRRGLRLNDPK